MLHPAQLHFLLSNYLLPVSHVPSHWTPTQEDALHAVKTGKFCNDSEINWYKMSVTLCQIWLQTYFITQANSPGSLKESFDHHPSFELPTSGYTIDLTKSSDDMEHLQPYLDGLRKQLKSPKSNNDSHCICIH